MTSSIKSRLLLTGCAAALAVGLGASVGNGGAPLPDLDAIICRAPGAAPMAQRPVFWRLAAAKTEVAPTEMKAAMAAPDFADSEPPLWDGLGSLTWKITANAEAQKYFDQGLRLAHAFNHDEARRSFRKAQKLDPGCAMCAWGEALVLGPNINLPMPEDAVAPAFAALQKARALADKASPREQAVIAALAARYVADPKAARAPLDSAYAAAMGKLAAQFPDDDEIAVLYAEAVMDLSPWDYWMTGGAAPKPHSAPIVPTLERVLARNPDHPGAIHYYIHAVEASDRPERAEPHADRLRGAVPGAGHLVHMPSHIYIRLGRYLDALKDNKTAAAVDEKYLAETGAPMGIYRLGYYPHNVHFVLTSAQMAGDGPTVIDAAEKLGRLIPVEVARDLVMVHPVLAAPYFAHAQFSAPEKIYALPEPGSAMPYVQAMWHYAQGIAQATQGNGAAAEAEAKAIDALTGSADFAALIAGGVPAPDVLKLAATVLRGRIAQQNGDSATAIARLREAALLQDRLPYMEPPYWYYPVRQSLAAALLQAGRVAEAEEQFQLALRKTPHNGWSYYGLAELYRSTGDTERAREAEANLAKTWIGNRELLSLARL